MHACVHMCTGLQVSHRAEEEKEEHMHLLPTSSLLLPTEVKEEVEERGDDALACRVQLAEVADLCTYAPMHLCDIKICTYASMHLCTHAARRSRLPELRR